MIFSLFRRKPVDPVDFIYPKIVEKARQPGFYLDCAVPDTVEGRFEMILLHLAIVFHRFRDGTDADRSVAQRVVEAFFTDMDRSLREMGIGDTSVPKKMKKLGQAYNGRLQAYHRALDARDTDDFSAIVIRNVMARDAGTETDAERAGAAIIADYSMRLVERLATVSIEDLIHMDLPFVALTGNVGPTTDLTGERA